MIPQSVLIVDDDDYTSVVKFVLEQDSNWYVTTVENGAEAIVKAELEQPDLILLDVTTPDFKGLKVYKSLKSDLFTCNIPIILMTAMPEIVKIIRRQVKEDEEIMTKPFDLTNLASQVVEVVTAFGG